MTLIRMWHDRGELFDPEEDEPFFAREVDLEHDALGMVVLQAYEDHLEGVSPRETEIITHRADTGEWRQCKVYHPRPTVSSHKTTLEELMKP